MVILDFLAGTRLAEKKIAEGVMPPKWYRITYYDFWTREAICHFFLISFIVQFARIVQARTAVGCHPDVLTKAFLEGYSLGRKREYENLTMRRDWWNMGWQGFGAFAKSQYMKEYAKENQ